jgi:CBS domain-containing protein
MKVKGVMTTAVETINPDSSLQEAAERMKDLNIGPLPVCEGGQVVGMLTDRDIAVRAVAEGLGSFVGRVRDVMTPHVVSCFEDQDVEEAARLMKEHQIRRLVVLNRDQRLVGIVSLGDLAMETDDAHLAAETLERVSEPVFSK